MTFNATRKYKHIRGIIKNRFHNNKSLSNRLYITNSCVRKEREKKEKKKKRRTQIIEEDNRKEKRRGEKKEERGKNIESIIYVMFAVENKLQSIVYYI